MKRVISIILSLFILVLSCGCSKHEYIPFDIEQYTTEDIIFRADYDTYYTDAKAIKFSFTYTGTEPWVYLSETGNCYLVKEINGELMQLEITGGISTIWDDGYYKPNETRYGIISLGDRYNLPLDTGTYRLVWDNYLSEPFEIKKLGEQNKTNDYKDDNFTFTTEHKTYYTDTELITCYFTYTGEQPWVFLSERSNCILLKENNGRWEKVRFAYNFSDVWQDGHCDSGETRIEAINLSVRYKLPLKTGTYRFSWDDYLSETFEIIERE